MKIPHCPKCNSVMEEVVGIWEAVDFRLNRDFPGWKCSNKRCKWNKVWR